MAALQIAFTGAGRLKSEGAIADYTLALSVHSRNLMALYNCGLARMSKGDYDKAIALKPEESDPYVSRGAARNENGGVNRRFNSGFR